MLLLLWRNGSNAELYVVVDATGVAAALWTSGGLRSSLLCLPDFPSCGCAAVAHLFQGGSVQQVWRGERFSGCCWGRFWGAKLAKVSAVEHTMNGDSSAVQHWTRDRMAVNFSPGRISFLF